MITCKTTKATTIIILCLITYSYCYLHTTTIHHACQTFKHPNVDLKSRSSHNLSLVHNCDPLNNYVFRHFDTLTER